MYPLKPYPLCTLPPDKKGWVHLCQALSPQPGGSPGPGLVFPKPGPGLEKPLSKYLQNGKYLKSIQFSNEL